MDPSKKRQRDDERPSLVLTRVVPHDPLSTKGEAPPPIVVTEVTSKRLDQEAFLPNAWHAFRGRDGKAYRGRVPIAMFPVVWRFFELVAETQPELTSSGAQVYNVRRVSEVRPRNMTYEHINCLIADLLRPEYSHLVAPGLREHMVLCTDGKWIEYFHLRRELVSVFATTDSRDLAHLNSGIPPLLIMRDSLSLSRNVALNTELLATHPYLGTLFAFLPLHRTGAASVRDVVTCVTDARSTATIRANVINGIVSVLAKQPLALFYLSKAPLFLGALSIDVLPVVLSNANPGTYTEQDIHDLNGYRVFLDGLREGPGLGYVCLPAVNAEARIKSKNGDLSSLLYSSHVVKQVEERAGEVVLTDDYVYEYRMHSAMQTFARGVARKLPQTTMPAESHYAAAVDRLFGDKLTPDQLDAVKQALLRGVTIFGGMSGSGRTHALAAYAALAIYGLGYQVLYVSPNEPSGFIWVQRFLYFVEALLAEPVFAELRQTCPPIMMPGDATYTAPEPESVDLSQLIVRHTANGFLKFAQASVSPRYAVALFDTAACMGLMHVSQIYRRFANVRKLVMAGVPYESVPIGVGYPFAALYKYLVDVGGVARLSRKICGEDAETGEPKESQAEHNLAILAGSLAEDLALLPFDSFQLDGRAWYTFDVPGEMASSLETCASQLLAFHGGDSVQFLESTAFVALGFDDLDILNLAVYRTVFRDVIASSGGTVLDCYDGLLMVGERLASTVTRRINAETNQLVSVNDIFTVKRLQTIQQLHIAGHAPVAPPFYPNMQQHLLSGAAMDTVSTDVAFVPFKETPDVWNASILTTNFGTEMHLCAFRPGCGRDDRDKRRTHDLKRAYVMAPPGIVGCKYQTVVVVVSNDYAPRCMSSFYAVASAASVNLVVIGRNDAVKRVATRTFVDWAQEANDFTINAIETACSFGL